MLVLTRKLGESIIITAEDGSLVEVKVVQCRGDKIRLAVTAPKHIRVDRSEVHLARQRHKLIVRH